MLVGWLEVEELKEIKDGNARSVLCTTTVATGNWQPCMQPSLLTAITDEIEDWYHGSEELSSF